MQHLLGDFDGGWESQNAKKRIWMSMTVIKKFCIIMKTLGISTTFHLFYILVKNVLQIVSMF